MAEYALETLWPPKSLMSLMASTALMAPTLIPMPLLAHVAPVTLMDPIFPIAPMALLRRLL